MSSTSSMRKTHGGKGDKFSASIDIKKYRDSYDRIFGKKESEDVRLDKKVLSSKV